MSRMLFTRRRFLSAGTLALSGAALSYAGLTSSFAAANKEVIRVGVIGTGTRGTGLAKLIKSLEGITVTAYCDILDVNAEKIKAHISTKAKRYSDYRKLLEDKEVDAVIIATPLYLHYVMAKDALSAGKHVYVEKSMTYDIPQALDLERRVNSAGLVFQVGHQYRYFGLYHSVKKAIDEGWLGKVTHFECQYHRNSDWRFPVVDKGTERIVNWRMYKEYSGGLMAELCGHQLDIVNWMTNAHPERVVGMGGINYWNDGRETYDNVRAVFEYPNGVKANVSSILSNAYHGYEIRVLGSKATLQIERDEAFIYAEAIKKQTGVVDGVTGATLLNATQGKATKLEFAYQDEAKRDPSSYALLDFATCIRENKKPFADVKSGKYGAIAVHMANMAMDKGDVQYWQKSYGG